MDNIRERLEAGLYREIRITRYTVRLDGKARAEGLHAEWGLWDEIAEKFLPERYVEVWRAEQAVELRNYTEGPYVVDVEADIRKLLEIIGSIS